MAGGIFKGLGVGLQNAARTFMDIDAQDKLEKRQLAQDALNKMIAEAQLKTQGLQQQAAEENLANLPRERAKGRAGLLESVLGPEAKFDSPEFVAALQEAGIDLPTREPMIPSKRVGEAGPFIEDDSVSPTTKVVLPPEVRDARRNRKLAEDWLQGDGVMAGLGGGDGEASPMDRAMYRTVFKQSPNEVFGAPPSEGSDFNKHFTSVVREREAAEGRKLTRAEANQLRRDEKQAWDALNDRPLIGGAMTEARKVSTFNQIAGNYQRSPLIRAADRTIVLSDAVKAIAEDPSNPSNQMNLAYAYIQALDTYQSAVREGELRNLGVLATHWQQLAVEANRVATSGAFVPPKVALDMALNAKRLVSTIEAGRQAKLKEFSSQAKVSGVGDMWNEYVAGFNTMAPTNEGVSDSVTYVRDASGRLVPQTQAK